MVDVKTTFTVLLIVSLLGIAACGGDGSDGSGTSAKQAEPIRIKTQVHFPGPNQPARGEVVAGSTIGDSAFCAGGTFVDAPVKPPATSVVRTFHCHGGTLMISFDIAGSGGKQSGDWKVVSGLLDFEGLSGGGRMKAVLGPSDLGRETLTGTVTP
jgi:hypothetical protein